MGSSKIYNLSEKDQIQERERRNTCRLIIGAATFILLASAITITILLISRQQTEIVKASETTPERNLLGGGKPAAGSCGDGIAEREERANHTMGTYAKAAVASDADNCSTIGREILQNGGSAVDSAIATLLCVGVYNMHSAGIGGGFFMLSYDSATNKTHALDAREVAPQAANSTMFSADIKLADTGALAIAVPGEIKGYWEAHQKFGKLPWADLFEPTIRMCEDGFPVGEKLSIALVQRMPLMLFDPQFHAVFWNATDGPIIFGKIAKHPKLAETLRTIATEGADAFYKGSLTADIVSDITARGGIIT